jgi:hypothetical protein
MEEKNRTDLKKLSFGGHIKRKGIYMGYSKKDYPNHPLIIVNKHQFSAINSLVRTEQIRNLKPGLVYRYQIICRLERLV